MAGRKRTSLSDRFQEKYVCNLQTGCWEWVGAMFWNGYGQIWCGEKSLKAHRVSWELHNGPIPEGDGYHGTCVCHKCDNRKCVNPDHLFLGSHKDNVSDRNAKGRQARQMGSLCGASKLRESDVLAIREMLKRFPPTLNKYSSCAGIQRFLARWFGVDSETVGDIYRNKTWVHLC